LGGGLRGVSRSFGLERQTPAVGNIGGWNMQPVHGALRDGVRFDDTGRCDGIPIVYFDEWRASSHVSGLNDPDATRSIASGENQIAVPPINSPSVPLNQAAIDTSSPAIPRHDAVFGDLKGGVLLHLPFP
jgi:hypothetical protein